MTFHYTDPFGATINTRALATIRDNHVIAINIGGQSVYIPVDRVEELIAGIRDTARQAANGGEQR
jgi:hypothetical protein